MHAADRTGVIIYEVQFFFNFNLSKKFAENIFFLTSGMFKGRYSSGGRVGPSENGIFGRKAMGVEKFNFFQCVGFVLRFV